MLRSSLIRQIYTSCAHHLKNGPKKAKSHSSHQWLSRQMSDPFVELAKTKNYRLVPSIILRCLRNFNKIAIKNENLHHFQVSECIQID